MRESEYNAYEALRGAAAVRDHDAAVRHEMARDYRRRVAGAEAIGMLSGLLKMDALPGIYRAQAQRLLEEWER
jgi:hypothetical protein